MNTVSKEDLKRIEHKLDALMKHFNVGAYPRRSNIELARIAREKVLEYKPRKKKVK